jgi:hypothetical protein
MNRDTKEVLGIVLVVIVLLALLGIGPVLTVMSLNALFNLGIVISFWNWLAMLWLQMVTFGGVISNLVAIKNKL